jgi:hypothetical protein
MSWSVLPRCYEHAPRAMALRRTALRRSRAGRICGRREPPVHECGRPEGGPRPPRLAPSIDRIRTGRQVSTPRRHPFVQASAEHLLTTPAKPDAGRLAKRAKPLLPHQRPNSVAAARASPPRCMELDARSTSAPCSRMRPAAREWCGGPTHRAAERVCCRPTPKLSDVRSAGQAERGQGQRAQWTHKAVNEHADGGHILVVTDGRRDDADHASSAGDKGWRPPSPA